KFILDIPTSNIRLSVAAYNELRDDLREILHDCKHVSTASLYKGSGFCQFMIMGKVESSAFSTIKTDLIDRINQKKMQRVFGVRTYTHIVTGSAGDTFPMVDRLPSAEIVTTDVDPVEKYLEQVESDVLEFKGSAFVDLNRYFLGDGL